MHKYPLILTSSSSSLRFVGSSITPAPWGAKNRAHLCASSEQPKSIYFRKSEWIKYIDFQAVCNYLFINANSHILLFQSKFSDQLKVIK